MYVTDKFTPTFSSLGIGDDTSLPEHQALLESCQYTALGDLNVRHPINSNLLVVHVNIRSLPKNFDALERFVHSFAFKPHIILVTETWLDDAISASFNLDGYNFETSSQPDPRGKGSAVYIDNTIVYSRRKDLESHIHQHQSIFVEFKPTQSRTIVLGSVYRSPSFPSPQFVDYLEETLTKVNSEHKLCLLGGDFNIDILKHHTDDTCSHFINSLSSLGFFPCVCLPTRITSHSATLIDNFFCNELSYVKSSAVIAHDVSDHLPISIHIRTGSDPKEKPHILHRNSFDFRNIDKVKHALATKLSNFSQFTDAEAACVFLTETVTEAIARYSIVKASRRSVPFQPWISHGLLRCINRKNYLHKKFIHSPTPANEGTFKRYRNTLNQLVRSAKAQYYKRKLQENKYDSRKVWEVLLTMIKKKKTREDLPSFFVVDGTNVDNPDVIANKFNKFLCNVAPTLEASIPQSSTDPLSYLGTPPSNHFLFHPTNNDMVYLIINELNNCGAGYDGISTKFLKRICPDIVPCLTHLFNLCLSQGVFPTNFKKAIVVPIFKSGDRFKFNNYRPISLLPILSKILEKIVYLQLSNYLADEGLLFHDQFGFRKNHSTYMPISILYDHITNELKNKQVCAAVFLDLSKAFDTVHPEILLKKLNLYGVHSVALDFFRSYLSGRTQILKYNSTMSSSPLPNSLGVPQGSILGPLLFLLYINDIHRSSSAPKFLLYADDTALLFTAPTLEKLQDVINNSLPNIATWLSSNRLTLNVNKSTYQLFSIKNRLPDIRISIGGSLLSRSQSFKYLGVTIDENLKWCTHIKNVENTISRNIGLIGRSQYMLDSDHIILLYNALVLPFLNYCVQVWANTYPSNMTKLIILQKKIIRIIAHAHHRDHTNPIFKKFKILKFPDLVEVSLLKVMHAFLTGSLPSVMRSYFTTYPQSEQRSVRSPQHFQVPFAPTNYRKHSLFVSAPAAWNKSIASNLPNIEDVPRSKPFFNKVVKKIFTDKY